MDFYIVVTNLDDAIFVYNIPVNVGENPITVMKQRKLLDLGEVVVDVTLFDPTTYCLVAAI